MGPVAGPTDSLAYRVVRNSCHRAGNLKLRYKEPDGEVSRLMSLAVNQAPSASRHRTLR
jgi:hypothetical protein